MIGTILVSPRIPPLRSSLCEHVRVLALAQARSSVSVVVNHSHMNALCRPLEWDQIDRTRQVAAIQAIVERIGYDGAARQISIRFHPAAITPPAQQDYR